VVFNNDWVCPPHQKEGAPSSARRRGREEGDPGRGRAILFLVLLQENVGSKRKAAFALEGRTKEKTGGDGRKEDKIGSR
jgi:hypothetical protein